MTTRDKRRARTHKRKNSTEEEQIPLYNESGLRHNARVIRQNMERDRQEAPMSYHREKHQQIPIGRKREEERKDMPYMNREGIEHNRKVIAQTMARDRGPVARQPEEIKREVTEEEKKRNAFRHLVEYFRRTRV